MIKIEHTEVGGWEAAIRGMRNPMNSWDKSDSGVKEIYGIGYEFVIGPDDMALMRKLAAAGSDHGKYLRFIGVTCDITAPLYWWKEFDTYKVGTVANSCSTMHKIHDKEFTLDDFSHEHLLEPDSQLYIEIMKVVLDGLNTARNLYIETKDKTYWWQMIQLLPSSYNQKRTVQMNYQVCWNMYQARQGHKLDEWKQLCTLFEALPYFADIFLDY